MRYLHQTSAFRAGDAARELADEQAPSESDEDVAKANGSDSSYDSVDEYVAGEHRRRPPKPKRAHEAKRERREDEDEGARNKLYVSQDHYKVLELSSKYRASADEIKAAYRRMVLKTHPDKNPTAQGTGAFEAVQLAYEVLSDAKLKRQFDSQYKCDDRLPPADAAGNFFDLYDPVFKRNARWSVHEPVPELGGPDTPMELVDRFYEFWFGFESWRDFAFLCQHDTSKAEDRFVRRQMAKENEREAKKLKNAENARLRRLVESAFAKDPRVARRRIEQDLARAREQAEARERAERERREKAEAAERTRAEAERAASEAAAAAAAERNAAKQAAKKARQTIRRLGEAAGCELVLTEKLANSLSPEAMGALVHALAAAGEAATAEHGRLLREAYESVLAREREAAERAEAERQARAAAKASASEARAWTRDEISQLAKAVAKFPGGTRNRWEEIAAFVGSRSPDECMKQVTNFRQSATGPKPATEETFEDVKARKKRGTGEIASELDKRFDVINAHDGEAPPASAAAAASVPATAGPGAPGPPAQGWTSEQQKALEDALKKHPASLGAERWTAIAAEVPGRTKKECKDRFKMLVEYYAANKKK